MAVTTTTLASAMGRSDLTAVLADATGAATGNTVIIGGEYMRQSGDAVGVIIPVQRGLNGSAQLIHAAAAAVRMGLATDFDAPEPTQASVYVDGSTVTGDGSSGSPLASVDASGGVTLTGDNVFTGANTMPSLTLTGAAAPLRTNTTTAHTMVLQAYDVNGTAYKTFATLTNGDTPSLAIAPPSGGTVTVQGVFSSNDATAGATAGPFTLITAIEVKNGLVVTLTGS